MGSITEGGEHVTAELARVGKLQRSCGLGSNGEVININRDDDLDVIPGVEEDGGVRLEAFEAQRLKTTTKLLHPRPRPLLEAIERLVKQTHLVSSPLMESFRLHHVELLIQFTIGECRGDVQRAQMEAFSSRKSQDEPESSRAESGCKHFSEVNTRTLCTALDNQASLV